MAKHFCPLASMRISSKKHIWWEIMHCVYKLKSVWRDEGTIGEQLQRTSIAYLFCAKSFKPLHILTFWFPTEWTYRKNLFVLQLGYRNLTRTDEPSWQILTGKQNICYLLIQLPFSRKTQETDIMSNTVTKNTNNVNNCWTTGSS